MGDVEESTRHSFSTRAIHAGQDPDPATGAVVTPISLSTTFAQEGVGRHKGFEYSRSGNPTRSALEAQVASLEEARHGLAFASGLSAEDNILRLLRPGQRTLLGNDAYGGTFRLIAKVWSPLGFPWSAVDLTDLDALRADWPDDVGLVWLETPTNPLLTCFDIEAIAEIAHNRGAIVVVDNTFATPYLQQPLTLGADIVVHSATKYLGGHSDVVGGFVAVERRRTRRTTAVHAERRRCRAVAVRLLSRAARGQDPRGTHGPPLRERPRRRRPARRPPGRRPGAVPTTARSSRSRSSGEADARLRRHGVVHRRRGDGCRHDRRRLHRDLHAGRVARRRREPHRTPGRHDARVGGRITARGARQPRASVGRHRGCE